MGKKTASIKNKIDYFFISLIFIVVCFSLYINQHRNNFIELTDSIQNSYQIKEVTSELARQLQTNDLSSDEQQIQNSINKLKLLLTVNSRTTKELDAIQTFLADYYSSQKVLNSARTTLSSGKNNLNMQASLLLPIQNKLMNINYAEEIHLKENTVKLESIKSESYTASVILILLILLIITVLYIKVRRDVNVKEKTEIELINKSEEIEQINRNKEKLFSIIAHDLRSPFHPILTIAEILVMVDDPIDKKDIHSLGQKLNQLGESVLNLLDNLLAWSRIQTGTLTFHSELFSIKEKVDLALENLNMEADKKNIKVYNEVKDNLWIISDHNILLSLLQNLISNAIKFTHSGGTVRIDGKMENENILISVSDTGVGIPKEKIDLIFTPSSIHTTLGTNKEKGSGLGLLLCKEYVELHQGKIWAESEPDKGSTFYFTIPVKVLSEDKDLFTYFKVKTIRDSKRKSKNLIGVRI